MQYRISCNKRRGRLFDLGTVSAALIRGRCLFQCGHPKEWRLLEGGAYLRPGAYMEKYGECSTKYKFKRDLSIN